MDYNAKPPEEFIRMVLKNYKYCPCLMIGEYVDTFKRLYKDVIERIYTLSDVKRVVEEYDGIERVNSGVLILEGVGNLSDVGQNSLLKFIEESKLPLILLSYNDLISPIIMSRMKIIVKKWKQIESFSFLDIGTGMRNLMDRRKDPKFKDLDEAKFLAENCPMLYPVRAQAGDPYDFYNSRMVNIMCGVERVVKNGS